MTAKPSPSRVNAELKPDACPLCSGTSEIRGACAPYFGRCRTCGTDGPVRATKEAAILAWNTRPAEDALRTRVAELEGALDAWITAGNAMHNLHMTMGSIMSIAWCPRRQLPCYKECRDFCIDVLVSNAGIQS